MKSKKKFVVFYDDEERFLGALPADSRIGDLVGCGLRGVRSMETLDIGGLELRLSSQQLDDQAEEELLAKKIEEMNRLSAEAIIEPVSGLNELLMSGYESLLAECGLELRKKGK